MDASLDENAEAREASDEARDIEACPANPRSTVTGKEDEAREEEAASRGEKDEVGRAVASPAVTCPHFVNFITVPSPTFVQ